MDNDHGPVTLAIDMDGTRLTAGLLDSAGAIVAGRETADTPRHAAPQDIVRAMVRLAGPPGRFDRASIGFPGAVRGGYVLTAPNLDTVAWRHFPLASALSEQLGKPVRVLNDAQVQGLGAIAGSGIECAIAPGIGFGFALFRDGRPGPHLDLAHHPLHKGKTYEEFAGGAALKTVGRKRWNRRMKRVLSAIADLTGYDILYIVGGNARQIDIDLPANVRIVADDAGMAGGVRLWDPALDDLFRMKVPGAA
jgi:polyphosphate glucokinase